MRNSSRAALVDAAYEEFTLNGYEATTVAGIAERGGVTTGALYAHFGGKLELLMATLGVGSVGEYWRELAAVALLPWSEARLELSRGLARPRDERILLVFDIFVLARRDPQLAAELRTTLLSYLHVLEVAAETGARQGLIDPALDGADVALVLAALSFGLLVLEGMGAPRPAEDALTTLIDLLLQADGGAERETGTAEQQAPLARVRSRSRRASTARIDLHRAIVDAAAAGLSLRAIGEAADLSHERVRQIVAEATGGT